MNSINQPMECQMFNMTAMAHAECAVFPEERLFAQWLKQLRGLLGMQISENDIAWDLFADGCTPEEAQSEVEARGVSIFAFLIEHGIQCEHVYVQAEDVGAAVDLVDARFSHIQRERRTFVGTRSDCLPDFVA